MNIVIIGAQWGDEGKGKIVDFLAREADVVIRFSGGANAGHTVVSNGNTYKLHLIPSGIIYPEKKVILGNAMVIDPEAFFHELTKLEEQGVQWENRVFISDRAHIVLPAYKLEDKEKDNKRKRPIGTTGRGIGITYSHKANRDGIRFADLFEDSFYNQLDKNDRDFLGKYRERLRPLITNMAEMTRQLSGKNILLEGAQGTLLDLDLGTYPFVSSGISSAAGASIGSSIGPKKLDKTYGVFKAYSTRVGHGPFPTEFKKQRDGNLGDKIREIGNEYGVTTGRARKCGYLDLVALKYACEVNGLEALVLTHLDVYDGFTSIKLCVAYNLYGQETITFPTSIEALNTAEPVLKTFNGWQQPIAACKNYDDLPPEAKEYVSFIEKYVNLPIEIISVGNTREATIVRKQAWKE